IKDGPILQMRNEFECPLDNDARNLQTELTDEIAPSVARFVDRLLGHKVEFPKREDPMFVDPNPAKAARPVAPVLKPNDPVVPPKDGSDDMPASSRILISLKDKSVEFTL